MARSGTSSAQTHNAKARAHFVSSKTRFSPTFSLVPPKLSSSNGPKNGFSLQHPMHSFLHAPQTFLKKILLPIEFYHVDKELK